MFLEQELKFVWDLITNRNDADKIFKNGFMTFLPLIHIETNTVCTPFILEGLLFNELDFL